MNYDEVAKQILGYVGGKENVSFVTFCATRLRLTLKDKGLIDEKSITEMNEVFGVRHAGAQFQIIIGNEVGFVYKAFCRIADIQENSGVEEIIEEDKDIVKGKITIKSITNNVMDVVSACITQVIPIIIFCGLIKLIVSILGPNMLNVLPVEHDLMRLLTFVGDTGFYFYPIFLAYGCAKKFDCSIPLSLLFACILIHPTLIEIVSVGKPFTVYGIPMILGNYTYSFLPILLTVWILSYIEKLLNRWVPTSLKMLLVPLGTVLIMLPLALCVIGPMGTVLGQIISDVLVALSSFFGPIATALIAGLFPFLIATGMHMPIITVGNMNMMQNGFESAIFPASNVCTYTMIAIGLVAVLKAKKAEERALNTTGFLTMTVGGISEPTIFGVILKNPKAIAYVFLGGLAGGFYIGLMHCAVYIPSPGNFLTALCYGGGSTGNMINGVIACAIAFVVTFALGMVFGFDKKKEDK